MYARLTLHVWYVFWLDNSEEVWYTVYLTRGEDMAERICPSCEKSFNTNDCGESSLYAPNSNAILICSDCFHLEDAIIEAEGTNDLPDIVARYKTNMKKHKSYPTKLPIQEEKSPLLKAIEKARGGPSDTPKKGYA